MDVQLLLFVVICAFDKNNAQVLNKPDVSVSSPVITETESVTVRCHTPSHIHVSHCDFHHLTLKIREGLCVQTLTGAELLQRMKKNSPAQVELKCSYSVKLHAITSTSADSDSSTITINNLLQPKLMVEPLEITETDTVTITCQLPWDVRLSTCYFHFSGLKTSKKLPCLKTLKGNELLSMVKQLSPSEVEVTCLYLDSHPSPWSNVATIVVHPPRPELTGNAAEITEEDSVILNCRIPPSPPITGCYLEFIRTRVSKYISCDESLTGAELLFLARQSSPAQVDLVCFYTVRKGGADQNSPYSNTFSIRIGNLTSSAWSITVRSSTSASVTPFAPKPETSSPASASGVTVSTLSDTDLTSSAWSITVRSSTSASVTPFAPTLETSSPASTSGVTVSTLSDTFTSQSTPETPVRLLPEWWKWMLLPLSFGVTVGSILLGMVLFCRRRRSEESTYRGSQPNHTGDSVGMQNVEKLLPEINSDGYSEISVIPSADPPAGFQQPNRDDAQNFDVYHEYATIPDVQAALIRIHPVYHTQQAH